MGLSMVSLGSDKLYLSLGIIGKHRILCKIYNDAGEILWDKIPIGHVLNTGNRKLGDKISISVGSFNGGYLGTFIAALYHADREVQWQPNYPIGLPYFDINDYMINIAGFEILFIESDYINNVFERSR